ncbi:MAG: two-component sensor histidine kinase [Rhizobiales bacterium]|nr:two-component sensor histidine kinase [Hyphomicrobiales bacterium]
MALIGDIGTRMRLPRLNLRRLGAALTSGLPKGLYARSILIVVMPIVILQSVVAYVFMERHWQTVTRRLSSALTRDIAAIIEVIETYPQDERYSEITRIAADTFGLTVTILPAAPLPEPGPRPFFSLLDSTLSREISNRIDRPFWIDTLGNSNLVEIRISLDGEVLRLFAPRNRAYASNSHIFLIWMVGASLVLIAIALLFLRNQIKPIVTLAHAAEQFGKGRPVAAFRPRGAREVRQAAQAFMDMRERIERQMEQRTTMLSGVSHDLRTILTRFKLELAMLGDTPETEALRGDVDEMSRMLEDYLAFAQGDAGEASEIVDVPALLDEIAESARRTGDVVETGFDGEPRALVRALGFRRCIANLVGNAAKHANRIELKARHAEGWLKVTVDDDGPGIPADERENVFRPFYRLDPGRNVDAGGTGLGLAIARDIAISHGGDVILADSPLGGLRAVLMIPA